ncbi:DUF998 domain-containing protein [Nocardia sp. CDC159]|uniref:DUF998 domain-containing protein n=1 Tax=Nocardia pulmonis TaxID=2951408 RepID=A0A9X2E9B6_9NOCA|nr:MULTISPECIES: DUF998 domain-containing protein [Nocardia]MCM6773893.1 DUF998 domain-containing protein [Nocardia pulmonis]MCM6786780.1 DUF998 domain-containing protein [Nocardia sp. CDC159]
MTVERQRSAESSRDTARALVPAVAVGASLFIGAGIAQGLTRDGFDMVKHPLSLLSTGEWGWINIANFVVSGLLYLAGAYGIGRVLHGQPGGVWGPRWLALNGIGLIAGGLFVADPSFGFPAGAPPLEPDTMSWHGMLHGVAPMVGAVGFIGAAVVFAWRWRRAGRSGSAALTVVMLIGYLVLAAMPTNMRNAEGYYNFVPLWIAGVVAAAWMSLLSARILAETRDAA